MQIDQITTFIHTVPIFHSLEPEMLRRLAEAAVVRHFSKGEVLLEQDAEDHQLFVLVAGELQAYLGEKSVNFERELTRLYPGDYFGILGVLTPERPAASVRAVEDGSALVISRDKVDELFQTSSAFGRALCRSLASLLRQRIVDIPSIPFEHLESFTDLESIVTLLPAKISKFCQALVVFKDGDQVKVAMVNPNDERARGFIRDVLSSYLVEFVAISEADFQRHAIQLLGAEVDRVSPSEKFDELVLVNAIGERSPVTETTGHDLLPHVLTAAIRGGASDIHIEPGQTSGQVRLRIDGRLMPFEEDVTPPAFRQLTGRLKVMSDLDITNTRHPQDGRFLIIADGRRVEFRTSLMPCQGGEKIVLRLVAADEHLGELSNLFVSEPVAMMAKEVFRRPSGLVLVTGPTGSGKTTTLYAALNMLNEMQRYSNIVTIEDPVEYNLPYATQVQVDRAINLDFKDILTAVLRQDPDIILVGEIRDEESAAIAVEAAMTGHLVLSSLHTHSTLETLVRLRNLNVKPYLLASALKGVISQQLVLRLAPGYTQEVPPNDPAVERLKQIGVLENDFDGVLQRGVQTDGGPDNGEVGRVAVYETLSITGQLRDLIDTSAHKPEIRAALNDECFFSFERYSRLLLARGYVAPERIETIFPKKISLADFDD